eukprot:TRINITY_DN9580_c0_g1_i1.p1 TRINITY_DN9580_c0_g1~~TRINITY_DN9580_c0_g1_i1.p1  ORF type:complete len:638 (+),score=92.20 TRINITY_DN9580_c0_g1_i1:506-2419(+)
MPTQAWVPPSQSGEGKMEGGMQESTQSQQEKLTTSQIQALRQEGGIIGDGEQGPREPPASYFLPTQGSATGAPLASTGHPRPNVHQQTGDASASAGPSGSGAHQSAEVGRARSGSRPKRFRMDKDDWEDMQVEAELGPQERETNRAHTAEMGHRNSSEVSSILDEFRADTLAAMAEANQSLRVNFEESQSDLRQKLEKKLERALCRLDDSYKEGFNVVDEQLFGLQGAVARLEADNRKLFTLVEKLPLQSRPSQRKWSQPCRRKSGNDSQCATYSSAMPSRWSLRQLSEKVWPSGWRTMRCLLISGKFRDQPRYLRLSLWHLLALLCWGLVSLTSASSHCALVLTNGKTSGQNLQAETGWSCSLPGIRIPKLGPLLPLASVLWWSLSKFAKKLGSRNPCAYSSCKATSQGRGNPLSGSSPDLTAPLKSGSLKHASQRSSRETCLRSGWLRSLTLLVWGNLIAYAGFSRGRQMEIQFDDLKPAALKISAFTRWLAPGRIELSAASWNARALYLSTDPLRRQAKINEVEKLGRNVTFTGIQEAHSCDALMQAQFRHWHSTHFILDKNGAPCWTHGKLHDSHGGTFNLVKRAHFVPGTTATHVVLAIGRAIATELELPLDAVGNGGGLGTTRGFPRKTWR